MSTFVDIMTFLPDYHMKQCMNGNIKCKKINNTGFLIVNPLFH